MQGPGDSRHIEGYRHQPAEQGQEGQENPHHPAHQPDFHLAQALSQPGVQLAHALCQIILGRKLRPVRDVRGYSLRLWLGHMGLGHLSTCSRLAESEKEMVNQKCNHQHTDRKAHDLHHAPSQVAFEFFHIRFGGHLGQARVGRDHLGCLCTRTGGSHGQTKLRIMGSGRAVLPG